MSTIPMRRPWQGVLQILELNWRSYAFTAAFVGVALIALPFLPLPERLGVILGAAPAFFWLVSSLIVSHYVYDRFPLYDLNWIAHVLSRTPLRWINIHCGLDETSTLVAAIFPDASGQVIDIFDPRVMTETSINQARQVRRKAPPARTGRHDDLGFPANSFDAAFCIFTAHELRRHDQRVKLFEEIARVLVPGGELVLMEHSCDWRNLLAFGPGFLHFFSQRGWRKATTEAGLVLKAEFCMTPFVHVYILRRTV